MFPLSFPTNTELLDASRLRGLARRGEAGRGLELATLAAFGACAALVSTFLDIKMRIPGHAILRAVLPLSLGLALVPRRGAGTLMTAASLVTLAALFACGFTRGGSGALTSLLLTGPGLDYASRRVSSGWRLYGRFALAGLGVNLVALAVRASTKALGWERAGSRQLPEWWPEAVLTYGACGLVAGLLSALLWFRLSAGRNGAAKEAVA